MLLCDHNNSERALTLIELLFVVVLLALITTVAATNFSSISSWQLESDLNRFANTMIFLREEANSRNESYRMTIDLERNSYFIRREVPLERGEIKKVDYLENLRTKGEKERKKEKEQEESSASVEEEFQKEDRRQSGPLEELYYNATFRDPFADVRLSLPLQSPSLGEEKKFSGGLKLKDIEFAQNKITSGQTELRFFPAAFSTQAVIHFESSEGLYSIFVIPGLNQVKIKTGEHSYSDAFKNKE
jgi:hypothetical protein